MTVEISEHVALQTLQDKATRLRIDSVRSTTVDLLADKHGIDPLAQAGLIREFEQQPDRLIDDARMCTCANSSWRICSTWSTSRFFE